MPRYSILLPTRNGASLLEGPLSSVLDQDYEDVELVVSDNASDDATSEILARHASDPRLKVIRQDESLPVTENWNAALAASTGDRITLIGDDDLLLAGYFEKADALLERHGDPDVLFFNGYAFAFPGFAGSDVSQYAEPFYTTSPPLRPDGELSAEQRRGVVEALFRFDFPLPLNFQTTLVTRAAAERLPHGLFLPPFPDFYALTGLLLTAGRWAITPERLVVVGVSPKSFGRTVHSSTSVDEARGYLGIDPKFDGHLPGSEVMNGHHETLLVLKRDFPRELEGIDIDRSEYAWQQAYSWFVQYRLGSLGARAVGRRARLLRPGDWAGLARLAARRIRPSSVRSRTALSPDAATATLWPGMRPLPEVDDIVGFGRWLEERT